MTKILNAISIYSSIYNRTYKVTNYIISTIIIYAFGIFRFSTLFPANSFAENLTIVLIPFLPGTLVKSAIAIPFAKKILPTVKNYLE